MRSAAALLCVLLIGSACGGSDSTEVEALEERIAELEEEKDVSQTSSKVTSSASKSSTSKSQPKASSSGLSIVEAKYLAEIMSEVTGTVDLFGAQVTRTQVQCFMGKLIAGRGIAGSERLNDSLASMGDYGGLPRSDASFFFGAVGACVDLLKAQKESARAETPELDVECAFKGVTKKDVEDWFIDFYVEGVQAFQEKVWDRVYYRIPDCLR